VHRPGYLTSLCLIFGLFSILMPGTSGSGTPDRAGSALEQVLELLHEGRFDQAELRLNKHPVQTSHDKIEKAYLRAFVSYWRLLYDPANLALRDRFDARLEVSIQTGENYLRESRDDPLALLYLGASHLLRAQLRAAEKSVFSAAYEAKKARKLLLKSMKIGTSPAESAFGLGTYEYFAARLPAVVRGLRYLLFLPGGTRDEGLRLLEKAAAQSDLFRFESRVVLISIYSGDDEQMYDAALEHAAGLLKVEQRAVTALYASARLFLDLGRPVAALDLLAEALDRATSLSDTSASVLAAIRFQNAKAEIRRFEFGNGVHQLEEMTAAGNQVPSNLRSDAQDLLEIYRPLAGSATEASLREVRDLLYAGEYAPVVSELAKYAFNQDLPWQIRRQARLLAGQANDLAGDRAAALRWYVEAEGDDAAALYRTRPFTMSDGF
jgi:hypothetical protein